MFIFSRVPALNTSGEIGISWSDVTYMYLFTHVGGPQFLIIHHFKCITLLYKQIIYVIFLV
jgi:hypothetical protein